MVIRKPIIEVKNLSKSYWFSERSGGLSSLFSWGKKKKKIAIKSVNFRVDSPGILGLVGPNGAEKTTLIKLLTGIIYPDKGEIEVLGYQPSQHKKTFLKQIGFLMGNRNHLWWNLPVIDSYNFLKVIYQVDDSSFKSRVKEFSEFLEISHLLKKPVRQLSLGERMRCQILAVFLHQPRLVFLDEPTLALDFIAQEKIRNFISYYQQKQSGTIILTSHYMKDIENLAERIIILNQGSLVFDGYQEELKGKTQNKREITIEVKTKPSAVLDILGRYQSYLNKQEGNKFTFVVPKNKIQELTSFFITNIQLEDIIIGQLEIETIIRYFFQKK